MRSTPPTDHQLLLQSLFETQWHELLNALPDATLIVNGQGVIVSANTQVTAVFGYTPAELANAKLDILIPERYYSVHEQHLHRYFCQPQARPMAIGLDLFGRRKNGTEFPVEISLKHLQTAQGMAVICCIRDITDRKRAQEALLNDERFQLFLHHAPAAIAMFDRDMRYLAASQRWREDYQLGGDIIGLSHYELCPDSDHWKDIHRRCLAGKTLQAEEDIFFRTDGRKDWVRWQCHPWHMINGDIGGVILFTEMITARKHAEIELRKSEAHFHGIFDNAITGIAISSWDGHVQQCNAAFCKLLGYSLEELQGLNFSNLVHPDDREINVAKASAIRAGHLPYCEIENRYLHKNGDVVWVRKFISTLPDPAGEPAHFLVLITDITGQKRAEAELQASLQHLEQQVSERTQALEAARQQAEQGNTFKSRFLTAASHDLRQPLQSVGLYLSVLEQQLALPTQQQICAVMRQSLETMKDLLNTLLDISKLESGILTPNQKDFSLQELLARIVGGNRLQAAAKDLSLRYATQDCWVHSDPVLLERIIENLVSNAIRYTQRGYVAIDWALAEEQVRISVSDTGIGIPPGELTHIFDAYYQLDNPERNRSKGLGLGLTIVKHIAHILGMPLDVKSTPSQGSTFSVDVPLGKAVLPTPQTPLSASPVNPGLSKPVLLFIEDDPSIVKAMRMFLEIVRVVEVYTAGDGTEALAHIQAGIRPDLVISDYRLPGHNGVEVINQIRAATAADLPAAIMTGDTSMQLVLAHKLPDCTVLRKPVDTKRLLAWIAGDR